MERLDIDRSCIPYPRKKWYWVLSIMYLLVYTATAIFLFEQNKTVSIIYSLIYPVSTLLHAYICSQGQCPYIGSFCPGAFGWFLVGKFARLFKKKEELKTNKLIPIFFSFIMLSIVLVLTLPLYFYFKFNPIYSMLYFLFIIIYFLTFVTSICARCAGRAFCPTAKLSNKLNLLLFNINIFNP